MAANKGGSSSKSGGSSKNSHTGHRSSETGQFVTERYANTHPKTTQKE
jgi:hypothetical protein